jgi:hypothetical protein
MIIFLSSILYFDYLLKLTEYLKRWENAMTNKKQAALAICIMIGILLAGCSSSAADKYKTKVPDRKHSAEQQNGNAPTSMSKKQPGEAAPNQDMDPVKEDTLAAVSGPLTKLPWENDEDFIIAKENNDASVLLGAYCAVLKDPLPGEEYNVHLAASLLCGRTLEPSQVFSQNREIGPYNKSKGFREGPTYVGANVSTTIGGGVCKIASTLYNVVILSNLKIIERHNHSMPVPYVPYGQDATVSEGAKDFKFKNSTSFPILIWAQGIDNRLYIAFYGKEQPPAIEWKHEFLKTYKAPVHYRKNPQLQSGVEKTILEGMDGAAVRSYLIVTYKDGKVEKRSLGTSYYKPMPYLIEKGE